LQILHEQIAELKTQGTSFDFSWFLDRAKRQEEERQKADKKKTDYWSWDWAVILALVLFSTIILLCCILVLCGPDKHKPGT
jgi:hypothetical protein